MRGSCSGACTPEKRRGGGRRHSLSRIVNRRRGGCITRSLSHRQISDMLILRVVCMHFRATLLMGRVALCVVTDTEVEKSRIMSACHFTLWGAVCVFVVCVCASRRERISLLHVKCLRQRAGETTWNIYRDDRWRALGRTSHKHATGPTAHRMGSLITWGHTRTSLDENYLWFEFLILVPLVWNFYIYMMRRPCLAYRNHTKLIPKFFFPENPGAAWCHCKLSWLFW